MAASGVTISGLEEILGKIQYFEIEAMPAEIRKATRAAAKDVKDAYHANMENINDSGAMSGAAVVRALKRSRKRIGHTVMIARDKLFELYEAYHGRLPNPRKGETDPFFYVTIQELGDETHEGQRPLRRALYDNAARVVAAAREGLLDAIEATRVKQIKAQWVAAKIEKWRAARR